MRAITLFGALTILLGISCTKKVDIEKAKSEIFATEKAFEAAAKEKGAAQAFYDFAAPDAVILRSNDSVIHGREGILKFYQARSNPNETVNWTADFVAVSADGTLGYTYGKYIWRAIQDDGSVKESKGIFHTVWKKQPDGSWKYVWD